MEKYSTHATNLSNRKAKPSMQTNLFAEEEKKEVRRGYSWLLEEYQRLLEVLGGSRLTRSWYLIVFDLIMENICTHRTNQERGKENAMLKCSRFARKKYNYGKSEDEMFLRTQTISALPAITHIRDTG